MRHSFDRVRERLWQVLPGPVRRRIAPTVVGYLVLNLCTFGIDIALMTVAYRWLGVPYALAVSGGYLVALALAFWLNRWLNFRSHGPVQGEVGRYVALVAVNYGALVVGLSWLLLQLGLHFQLARLGAATAEAVFMYCGLRWLVFRQRPATDTAA